MTYRGVEYPGAHDSGRQQHYTDCTQKVLLIEHVEEAVVQHYATVQLSAEQKRDVRAFILDQLRSRRAASAEERARQDHASASSRTNGASC